MPSESIATPEQKLEWPRRRTTALYADTSYHLRSAKLGTGLRQATAAVLPVCDHNRHEQWCKLMAGPVPGAPWSALLLLGTED
jgi:hypothetical protein